MQGRTLCAHWTALSSELKSITINAVHKCNTLADAALVYVGLTMQSASCWTPHQHISLYFSDQKQSRLQTGRIRTGFTSSPRLGPSKHIRFIRGVQNLLHANHARQAELSTVYTGALFSSNKHTILLHTCYWGYQQASDHSRNPAHSTVVKVRHAVPGICQHRSTKRSLQSENIRTYISFFVRHVMYRISYPF